MIAEIMPRLYISSAQDIVNAGTESLKAIGIDAIVNVAERIYDDRFVDSSQFELYKYPLQDSDFDQTVMIKTASQKVAELLLEGKTVLVHCMAGISRSGIVIIGALRLLTHRPWSWCENELKNKNPPSRTMLNNNLLNRTIKRWDYVNVIK